MPLSFFETASLTCSNALNATINNCTSSEIAKEVVPLFLKDPKPFISTLMENPWVLGATIALGATAVAAVACACCIGSCMRKDCIDKYSKPVLKEKKEEQEALLDQQIQADPVVKMVAGCCKTLCC